MKKGKILIASVLKPVNEPRMYSRMAQSLSNAGYEVSLFGSGKIIGSGLPGIKDYGQGIVPRISTKRLLMPLKLFWISTKVKPDILIVNTHELLIVAILNKILFGCKIIYDIQENYFRNIWYTQSFPVLIRHVLALYVRAKEWFMLRFFDHLLLAEQCYQVEMGFIKALPQTVIENKFAYTGEIPPKQPSEGVIQLIFTGTLAESTGVFIAIALAKKLNQRNQRIRLSIVGFTPVQSTLDKIRQEIGDKPFIELITDKEPIAHHLIIEHLQSAHFGIIAYPDNPSTSGSMPSKLYEYMALALPILYLGKPYWSDNPETNQSGISFDLDMDAEQLLLEMHKLERIVKPAKWAFWDSDEEKLLNVMSGII